MGRERGFTLLETTVLLAIVSLLAAMLVGTVADFLERARLIKAQKETEEIGRAIASFYVDTGVFPLATSTIDGRPGDDVVGILVSDGPLPDGGGAASWWVTSRADRLNAHLHSNDRGYVPQTPGARLAWRGPYLPRPLEADPWGAAYLANVFYLDADPSVRAADGTPLGAVFVLSAGPNGEVDTPYFQPREDARLFGDDIGIRLR